MKVYYLGAVLVEMETALVNENNDETNVRNGKVILSESTEALDALKYADIVMDGDVDLKNIEFCKVESQQECLTGTLRIPRLSDISGSKFKIQFFVNKNNIVIIDDVKSPKGTLASISGPINSGTITTDAFEGENPSGKWTVYIQNSGVSYNVNIYPVSTVTVTLKVHYDY